MELINRELCATCPTRSLPSKLVASVVLGKNYAAENCQDGPAEVRQAFGGTTRDGGVSAAGIAVSQVCSNEQAE